MYNGTPTIAYHMQYFNEQTSQSHVNNITHQLPSPVSTSSKKIPAPTIPVSSKTNIAFKTNHPKIIVKLHKIMLIHFILPAVIYYHLTNHHIAHQDILELLKQSHKYTSRRILSVTLGCSSSLYVKKKPI